MQVVKRLACGGLFLISILFTACAPRSYWAQRSGRDVVLRTDAIADAWVELARERKLAFSAGWLKLGHFRRDLLGTAYLSDADGPGFFLSPDGRFDPEAELEATIRGVLAPIGKPHPRVKELDAHPACRFPARVYYLAKELGLDLSQLGVPRCPGFEAYMSELDPEGVTLVFTSYYLNNPASAFGHTFLRIRKANSYAIGEKRELLDYGIDFSADVTTENPVGYALMGLTGQFHGTFKRLPYYYKVREYNDTESRDLWEYDIALDPFQRTILTAHLWEVGSTDFDYYYIGENCSWAIFSLLDAARPELGLMEDITSPVIPAATVQALFKHEGLVTDVRFRPALRAQLDTRVKDLSGRERDLVELVERDPAYPLDIPDERAMRVLDAALDLLDTRHGRELLHDRATSEAAQRKQALLTRRAAIRIKSPDLVVKRSDEEAPQLGHSPTRVGVGGGINTADKPYAALDFRLALHDLGDPARGYPQTAQIEFFSGRVRLGETPAGTFQINLERLDVVHVLSLSSIERFDRHISFHVSAGGIGLPASRGRYLAAGHAMLGGGVAKSFAHDAITLWAMGDGELLVGRGFSRDVPDLPLRIGVGPSGGVRVRLHPDLVLVGSAFHYWFPVQDPGTRYGADATLRWQFVKDVAIGAEGRWQPFGIEGGGTLYAYF